MFPFDLGFDGEVASSWVIFGFYLLAIGWSIYSAVRGPGTQEIERTGPRIEDNKLTVSTLGTPKPICYGTVRLSGNIIWCGELEEEVTETEVEQGGGKGGFGGGGGISTTTRDYLYFRSLAIAFGEGAAGCRILKLFANGKLVWDTEGTGAVQVSGVRLKWHPGSETQGVDSLIESDVGTADCPAYRGTCYAVLDRFPLVDFGNAMPNFSAIITFNFDELHPVTVLGDDVYFWHGTWHEAQDAVFLTGASQATPTTFELSRFDITSETRTHNINLNTTLGTNAGVVRVLPLSGFVGVMAGTEFGVFDPNTLQLLATETHSYGDYLNPSGGAVFSRAAEGADYILVPGQTSRIVAYRIAADADGAILTNVLDMSVLDLTIPDGYLPTQTYANDAEADAYGHVWIVGKVQDTAISDAEPAIWQFALGADGLIVEVNRFDLTHVDFPADMALENVGYDSATHSLIILGTSPGTSTLFLWDIETQEEVWVEEGSDYTTNFVATAAASRMMFKHIDGSTVWLGCATTVRYVREFRLSDGQMLREYDVDDWFPIGLTRTWFYHWPTHSLLGCDQTTTDFVYTRAWLDRGTGEGVGLDTVVSDICVRAGLSTGDINVTDLNSEEVRGYRITRRASARAAIETLTKGYFFDAVESDFVLKFLRRAGNRDTGLTIPEDDLGVGIEAPGEQFLDEERVQDEEIPAQYDMRFINPDIDYQEDSAIAQRILSPITHVTSQSEQAADLPIVFTATEARRVAERWLSAAWTERIGVKFSLLPRWLRADPTDIFTVIANGISRKVRMLRLGVGESFDIEGEAVVVDQENYAATDSEGAVTDFTPQEIGVVSNSYMLALDIPLLMDSHDGGGLTIPIYLAVTSISASGWPGGVALKSLDLNSWTQINSFTSDAAYGWTTTALGDWTDVAIDTVSTVQVQLPHSGFSLTSISESDMLNGGNPAMIGSELVQFQNATHLGSDLWELDTFLRGRRGSEWANGGHSANERFVFLSMGSIALYQAPLTDLNATRHYRAISLGTSLTGGHIVSLNAAGVALKPYAPADVGAVRDSTANTLLVYWTRRSRIAEELDWTQGVEVPLGEAVEAYEVDLLHKTTGAVEQTYVTTGSGSRQTATSVTFSLPGGGVMRMESGAIDESLYTDAKLVRVSGAQDAGNNGTFLIDSLTPAPPSTPTQINVLNASAVARSDSTDTKVVDEIGEQVTIPNADLTGAGYTGITDSIDVVVYQLSAVVGRGYGTSATV